MRSYAKRFSITNLYFKGNLKVFSYNIRYFERLLNKLNIFFLEFKGTIFLQT